MLVANALFEQCSQSIETNSSMATFAPYERVHKYRGLIQTAPEAHRFDFEAHEDTYYDENENFGGDKYNDSDSSEDNNAFTTSKKSSQPKNASLCYVMDGGGLALRGDTTSNAGRVRLKEHERMNSENMRTHDRLMKIQSTIPATRRSKKPVGVVSKNGETRRRKEKAKLAAENKKLTKALNDIYRGKARLSAHGVKKKDCRKIWNKVRFLLSSCITRECGLC